jgi:hypothetical protein
MTRRLLLHHFLEYLRRAANLFLIRHIRVMRSYRRKETASSPAEWR